MNAQWGWLVLFFQLLSQAVAHFNMQCQCRGRLDNKQCAVPADDCATGLVCGSEDLCAVGQAVGAACNATGGF